MQFGLLSDHVWADILLGWCAAGICIQPVKPVEHEYITSFQACTECLSINRQVFKVHDGASYAATARTHVMNGQLAYISDRCSSV